MIGQIVNSTRGTKAITPAMPPETTVAILPEAQITPKTTTTPTEDRKITASVWEVATNLLIEEDPATHATHTLL